ncbi:MAG: 2-polyprenylphenol 6-hydroxylase [Rhodospirillaceae bacterium]
MLRTFRNLGRLRTIARSLAEHDALTLIEDHPNGALAARVARGLWRPRKSVAGLRPGQRLALALTSLGPTFIKFGQALSTRADLLGEQGAADLSELQDRLPPFPFKDAKKTIEEDFGVELSSLFDDFEERPVAAASIAQVHFALTTDGEEVAVKVLRPGVKDAFARDIDVLYWLAELGERLMPKLKRLRPVEVVRTFEETVRIEMDLRFEAAAAEEMAENFTGDSTFRVPSVHWQHVSEHVLTLERVSGTRVDDEKAGADMGVDPVHVVKTAAEAFFKMVFHHGFFHADMHPGNLFVTSDGAIIAMDFGIMGRVDASTQKILGEMLLGFLTRDYRKVAEVHIRAGFVPRHKSVDGFAQAARSIAEPILGKPISEISIARLLGQLFQITETFEMQTQPQLLLLQKSMLLAEGVGRTLAPEVNMWELAKPLIEDWMRGRLGPEAAVADAVGNTMTTLERLPRIIDRIDTVTADLSERGLKLHPETARVFRGESEDESRPRRWPVWLPWALAAALLAALILG